MSSRVGRGLGSDSAHPDKFIDGRQSPLTDTHRVRGLQVSQGHDRGNRQTRPLHDEPLSGRRLVENLSEPGPDVKGTDRSHGTMIVL